MAWQREIGWQRLDERGQERCVLVCEGDMCLAAGAGGIAINGSGLVYEYRLEFDQVWNLTRAVVVAHLGDQEFRLTAERHGDNGWLVDGVPSLEFTGCTDLDLEFSASTTTATIRRLQLPAGEIAALRVVYVNEPELKLEVAEQTYRRLDDRHYEFAMGQFTSLIEVDEDGVVIDYPGLFVRAGQEVAAGL